MKTRILFVCCLIAIAALPVFCQSSEVIGSGKTSHPVVKNKPEPEWPKSIEKKVDCTIVLRAVFTSKATVTNVRFVVARPASPDSLSDKDIYALAERAIKAAYQIKFVPATKDGRPVSMWMELEYNFTVGNEPDGEKVSAMPVRDWQRRLEKVEVEI